MFANNPYNEVVASDFVIEIHYVKINQEKYLYKMECMMRSSLP
jgi:hypothetical protein